MDIKNLKQGMPGFKRYARSHLGELFTIATVFLAGISAWQGYFFGTAGWSLLALGVTIILGVLFPMHADWMLRKLYRAMTQQSKTGEMIVGIIKLAVGILVPWLFFAVIGTLAGESYHYYTRHNRDRGDHYNKAA